MLTLLTSMLFGCRNGEKIITLGVEEFAKVVEQTDVKEYAEGHLAGAENIDVKDSLFADHIKGIEGKVAVYCRGGRRSLKAAEMLTKQGCTVYNLDGGILAWQKAGKTIVQ